MTAGMSHGVDVVCDSAQPCDRNAFHEKMLRARDYRYALVTAVVVWPRGFGFGNLRGYRVEQIHRK
jgi:hypothetical protein